MAYEGERAAGPARGQGGAAPPSGLPLHPHEPRMIGPYRLLSRLGAGGMGSVYLAEGAGGHRVAIKVVRPDLAADEEFRRRFRQEVDAARRVAPFCTAEVLDADPDAPAPYLVTEFIDGVRLDHAVENRPLGQSTLTGLAVGVATALTAIHGAGLVHRDLKPSNVLLSLSGPRVIDFGIAQALEGAKAKPTAWGFGSAGWMAPEQVNGQPIGPEADVFTWGILVAYAGTGEHPFGTGTDLDLSSRIVGAEPMLEGLPDDLRLLVAAALAKNPDDRPSARDLLLGLIELPPARNPGDGGQNERPAPSAMGQAEQLLSLTHDTTSPGLRPTRVGPPTSNPDDRDARAVPGQRWPVAGTSRPWPAAPPPAHPGGGMSPRRTPGWLADPPAGAPPGPAGRPHDAGDGPARPSRSRAAGWSRAILIIGVALVALVVAWALIQTSGDGSDQTAGTTDPSTSSPASDSDNPAPAVGVPVRDGQLEFTVESHECGVEKLGDGWLPPPRLPSGQYCLVKVQVENLGPAVRTLDNSGQYLRDDSGDRHSADFLARFYLTDETIWNKIDAGATVQGTMVFDLPDGTEPAELELHENEQSEGAFIPLS